MYICTVMLCLCLLLCVRACVCVYVCVSVVLCVCLSACLFVSVHACVSVQSMRVIVFACVCHSRLLQVQAMYFANPPVAPDLAFYKEVFEALVKFNDR